MSVWLDVVGIGEDGFERLAPAARAAPENAEVIIGGDRHHALAPHLHAERIHWPDPFSKMTATIMRHRGRRTAVLVTGDPLWYSAGARIARTVPNGEVRFHPQISAFQLACARMGWSLADTETLTAHGRPAGQIIPWMRPGARLLVLTGGSEAPGELARLLLASGFGASAVTVLAALGGPKEQRLSATAADWAAEDPAARIPAFHTVCIECASDPSSRPLSRGPGLPDDAFETDGNFTKREVRAVSVCMLAPERGALLWDIGTGCGTVAIEWMRAARDSRAIGIDPNQDRLELARGNAARLGAPALRLIHGSAPEALDDLPDPDAVFIGGGLTAGLAAKALERLRPFGRLVANAVTLESEAVLAELHAARGGELARLSCARAGPLGGGRGWRGHMPVTQWRYTRWPER